MAVAIEAEGKRDYEIGGERGAEGGVSPRFRGAEPYPVAERVGRVGRVWIKGVGLSGWDPNLDERQGFGRVWSRP